MDQLFDSAACSPESFAAILIVLLARLNRMTASAALEANNTK
jgi:hypothetical protein